MAEQFHGKSKRKSKGTGGRRIQSRPKRRYESGGAFTATKVSEKDERKSVRGRGGNVKVKLKKAAFANVLTKDGYKKSKIKKVLESADNRHYARMNIVTKGAIIETEAGKAKVLNRVGQDGVINAKLIE